MRDGALPGAIVTRVAASHVRVGTFEYFAARRDRSAVRSLADYVIDRHYPDLRSADRPYLELLRAVCKRQAALVASWMHVGFIHGVMNTDNTAVSGETIDFGPCAFMDAYDPATVFSSIDGMGRYAYANQPPAAQWNLARFAETLLALIDADANRAVEAAGAEIEGFSEDFRGALAQRHARKFGLPSREPGDSALMQAWLEPMHRNECDYTLTFRRLCEAADAGCRPGDGRRGFAPLLVPAAERAEAWASDWRSRLAREPEPDWQRAAPRCAGSIPRRFPATTASSRSLRRRSSGRTSRRSRSC